MRVGAGAGFREGQISGGHDRVFPARAAGISTGAADPAEG